MNPALSVFNVTLIWPIVSLRRSVPPNDTDGSVAFAEQLCKALTERYEWVVLYGRTALRYASHGVADTKNLSLVGTRIRGFRAAKGLGLGELADKSKLSKGYLSSLETGNDTNPSLVVLNKIARALDVTLAELLGTPRVKGKLELPEDLPPGLQDYVRDQKVKGAVLDTHTVVWLANAKFRGSSAATKEDYALLHRLLSAKRD